MKRDDIYDHLAQVYIGKRKEVDDKKKRQLNSWLFINFFITVIIFASAFYGLTAFLTQKRPTLESQIIYSLHNGPVRFEYNFDDQAPPTKTFTLDLSSVDATRYSTINFSVRGKEEGIPGIIKVAFLNKRNESAYYYIRGVDLNWHDFSIPLTEFEEITDWGSITNISFILESWNVDKKKGIVLIDDINFST